MYLGKFNILWLNPRELGSFPDGLLEALSEQSYVPLPSPERSDATALKTRLREQMRADALQRLPDADDAPTVTATLVPGWSPEDVSETIQFLRLSVTQSSGISETSLTIALPFQAQDRLTLVLTHLRDQYAYCFWCGVQYQDESEMEAQCPGPDEDAHD